MTALVDGYDRIDQDYIDDFLLLFRVFMTYDQKDTEKGVPPGMISLCLTLAKWLDDVDYRDKVIKIILTWLSFYYHDFELNHQFSHLFFRLLETRLLNLSMNNQLHLLHVTLSTKSKVRHVTISRSSREQPLPFSIAGGYEKNCGIFVTKVIGSSIDDDPFDNLMSYLGPRTQRANFAPISQRSGPLVPPRQYPINETLANVESSTVRFSAQLRPGDQILEVNGTNFSAIKLSEAQKRLDMSTHLSLTVKYNPSAFYEMRALPEGRRKSSMSSVSSVSPYPSNNQVFTFNKQEIQNALGRFVNDRCPSTSPLLSANFGFKTIKTLPKSDRSRISNFLINSSKQIVKQIRDSTANNHASVETSSKASDNVSDEQSNELSIGKTRSNPDLPTLKVRDKPSDPAISSLVKLDDLNLAAITEHQSLEANNQSLVNVLRVFNAANNDSKYLLVHEETTAREVVMVAVKEFNLTTSASQPSPGERTVSSLNWHLYEVSVVPESRTIKQKCLSEQTNRLAERASMCSRYYIKNNSLTSSGPTRLDAGDDSLVSEILKECPTNVSLTSLNPTLLAVELTLADFDKFRSIEPQQFVYDTFFNCSPKLHQSKSQNFNPSGSLSSQETASLKSSSSDSQDSGADLLHYLNKTRVVPKEWMEEYRTFADISNREMFWVICEILNEQNIDQRVEIVKQFVRIADVCSQLRNYNSMFAIISGLGHSCVTRLRRTFDKLKPKYKNQLENMRSLFDPSRNMSNYRLCLSQTQPPAIPLFPQIKKDLTFTKEGRSIFVREPNESDADREEQGGMGDFSQDTIKRKSRVKDDLLSVKSALTSVNSDKAPINNNHNLRIAQTRSISYNSFQQQRNPEKTNDSESILINFAEIRQFTERVRNVIYFSSVPYSNDLLTNTMESQRTQAQIKKMHEEWQMRKRIRHYISQTLVGESSENDIQSTTSGEGGFDHCDGKATTQKQTSLRQLSGKLNITYDERTLYKRSLEVEAELNPKPAVAGSNSRQQQSRQHMVTQQHLAQHQALQPQEQSSSQTSSSNSASCLVQPHLPLPVLINLQPPPILPGTVNSSPTLSKSSSLSSCSSFNHNHLHHLSSYHAARGSSNLTSSLGKFGTESTESLRKLKALSENVDQDWRSPFNTGNNNHTVGGNSDHSGLLATKSLVSSRILPKNGR